MRIWFYLVFGGFILQTSTAVNALGESRLGAMLFQAHQQGEKIPLITQMQPTLSVERAYLVQKYFVKMRLQSENIAGFKAGLTSAPGQKRFKVTQPVMGVLFEGGVHEANTPIVLSDFKRLMLETEIGYKINATISEPIADIDSLKPLVSEVFPVIEIPDLGFAGNRGPIGVDVIAANVASARFIVGQSLTDFTSLNFNTLQVRLMHDGEESYTGLGSDAMNNQWQAALWLVNMAVEQGWILEPGHIIITGAVGRMTVGKPGEYQADFSELGRIHFEITP